MPHPVLVAAAGGALPSWTVATPDRRAHLARVADLMGEWAGAFGLQPDDVTRWRAAGMLHDGLKDADPRALRSLVEPPDRDLPDELLHGPAAAARLRTDGVRDEPVLRAVAWHTTGHPALDRLGRALYLADYLEPGRRHASAHTARMRERVPADPDGVLTELAAERIIRAIGHHFPLRDPTVRFWNDLVQS